MINDKFIPPGSKEALDKGCTCPVIDNSHGRGYMGGVKNNYTGETIYVFSEECPLHFPDENM